jgi:tetratricopeptide (TPR) repeat protein
LVDELVAGFERVCESKTPSWWSLEANTGWGKTRVVQEFYARLAASQPEPAYWPSAILTAEQEQVKVQRKQVHPPLSPAPAGASPAWFWWGISCSSRHGAPLNALVHDLERFEERRGPLEARFRELAPRSRRFKHAYGERKGELAEAAIGEGLSAAASAASLAVPGLGVLVLLGRWGLQHHRRDRDPGGGGEGASDIVGEVAPALERFASVGIPLVIVIEDVHEADEMLIELLARVLAAKSAPVLVVTTCWRGVLDQPHRPVHKLLERVVPDRQRRVLCELEVPDLSPQDLGAIIDAVLPGADDRGRGGLAERYPNPFALQLVCQTRNVQRAAALGTIPDEVLEQLPREVDDLFRQLWEELPEPVRRTLVIAGQLAPGTISARLGLSDLRWDPELLGAVVERVAWLAEDLPEIVDHIQDADEAYAWVRTVDEWLQRFHDPVQHQIAADAIADEYLPDEQQELHRAAAEAASLEELPGVEEGSRRERATNRDRLLVALAAEGHTAWDEHSACAAARICSSLRQLKGTAELSIAIEICTCALAHPDALGAGQAAELREIRASCLGESGKVDEAIQQFQELFEDQTNVLGADAPSTLTTRNNLARWLAEDGQVTTAIEQFQQLLEDRTRVLGPDAPDTLTARNNLAVLLGQAGQARAAIEQLEGLLEDQIRVLGMLAPDTLRTRANLSILLSEDGRIEEATQMTQQVLEDYTRVLGADAPATLGTRYSLASRLGEAGQVKVAIEQLHRLLEDDTRVLGADSPYTLMTRSNLAYWIGASGQVKTAIEQLQLLLKDRTRVLGVDAPTTLVTRSGLASWLGRDGQVQTSIEQLERLLEDQTRVLGADARATVATRRQLAYWRGPHGQVKAEIEQLAQLLEERTRVLGAQAPETLIARNDLANCLGKDGEVNTAIEQLEQLLKEQTTVLGRDARDTLATRLNLAYWLGEGGQVKTAIEQSQELIEDYTRVLGADAPGTLTSRDNLANCLGAVGDVKTAIEQLDHVREDWIRVLGADAPDTLRTRNNLAYLMGEDGQLEAAIDQFELLVGDETRLLGADAPDTLIARGNLANCLRRGGQVKSAIKIFERLLEDQTRVLGPDSPDTVTTRENLARLLAGDDR